jgi:Domain of Unknown Function with PDB structure (DUF3857)/Transglutaminase-like superfamily
LPLDPNDVSLQKAKVDPNADAECLLWDLRVNDELLGGRDPRTTYTNYVRIKIFTDAGVKKYGTVDLEYQGKEHIGDISGHTIEPDGTVLDMKKDAIFDHLIEKRRRVKVHAVSFAMPGLKPGSIIEYRYKKFEDNALADYVPLEAQMGIPVERVVYHVKPLNDPYIPFTMRYMPFNTALPPFKPENGGYFISSLQNIPAFHAEDDAPPDREIRPWVLIYYSEDRKENIDKFWKTEGKNRYKSYSQEVKVNGDVKQIAEEQISGAKSDDEKLRKLYVYCQKHLKDINGSQATDADRESYKGNHNTVETLKRGMGTWRDIDLAFVALATAAGYDARLAYMVDREQMIFHKELMIPWLPIVDVAVNVGGKWRLYDPSSRYLPAGELRWQEQAVYALIADPKEPEFYQTAVMNADQSMRKQAGRLKLDEEGTLEGDLDQTLTGGLAAEWRFENMDHSVAEREKLFGDEVKSHLAGAEVTEIHLSDPADLENPVVLKCHVKVEGFATRTGKRLFFTPAVFQMNEAARYTDKARKYDMMLHYPWSEVEDVSVFFPEGFTLDHPDLAPQTTFKPVGSYVTRAVVLKNRILYHREFTFGADGYIVFPNKNYATIKQIFDSIHDNDAHLLTLRQEPAVAKAQ